MPDRVLVIRKTKDGTRLEGTLPENHVFSARFIEREIASGLVEVTIRLRPDKGKAQTYVLQGFERVTDNEGNVVTDDAGNEKVNFTGWKAKRKTG
jgi:hypothetical protein